MDHGEDLGFNPQGGGSYGGFWTKESCVLTEVLTGTLWLLQKSQSVGGEGRSLKTRTEVSAPIQVSEERGWPRVEG